MLFNFVLFSLCRWSPKWVVLTKKECLIYPRHNKPTDRCLLLHRSLPPPPLPLPLPRPSPNLLMAAPVKSDYHQKRTSAQSPSNNNYSRFKRCRLFQLQARNRRQFEMLTAPSICQSRLENAPLTQQSSITSLGGCHRWNGPRLPRRGYLQYRWI